MHVLKNQKGFAHQAFVFAIVVVAAISFVGGSVYKVQQERNEADRKAAAEAEAQKDALTVKTEEPEEKTEVTVPAPAEEQEPVETTPPKKTTVTTTTEKKKTEPSYTYFTIPSTTADVGAENVVFTANLGGSYSGYCKVLVKLEDGSNAQWFDSSFGPANTCSVSVSRAKLTASTTWKYYMYMKSGDGLTKAESVFSNFTLN